MGILGVAALAIAQHPHPVVSPARDGSVLAKSAGVKIASADDYGICDSGNWHRDCRISAVLVRSFAFLPISQLSRVVPSPA